MTSGTMDIVARGTEATAESIVGRADELSVLHRLLGEAVDDGSRLLLIGGDAGSGKTTVVEAFTHALGRLPEGSRPQVVSGQCVPLGGDGLPYAPIVGALRQLVERHGKATVLDWAGVGRHGLGVLLPDLVEPPPDADSLRLHLFEAVVRLVERAAEQRPLVLVVEDLHWADESTRHLLRFLVRALTDAPVLVVATFRTDELSRRHPLRPFLAEVARIPGTVRLDLPSLSREQVAELLTRLLERPPSPAVTDLVYRRSEGIPYFVVELTHSASCGCIDMPDTLRDALLVRVQTLTEPTQEILQLAAVAGNRVDHDLLEAVAQTTSLDLDTGLREAIDRAILRTDDNGYAFRHALLREVIHDDLLPGQHARLHARFAAALEARPDLLSTGGVALEIAHHWSAAHEVTKAFTWSVTAATSGSPAHFEALKMYERALDLWDRVDDPESVAGIHADVLDRAARAATDAGENERALALVTASIAETADDHPFDLARRRMLKSRLLSSLMRPGAAEVMQLALAELPPDAPAKLRAKVLTQLGTVIELAGGRADDIVREAVAVAQSVGEPTLESNARNTYAMALHASGRQDEALEEYERARRLAGSHTRLLLRYYINSSDALHLSGRFADAVDLAEAGMESARAMGLERSFGSMLAGNAAEPLLALGEWDRARHLIDRALELDPPLHHRVNLRMLQAWHLLWIGKVDEAEATLAEFRALATGPQVNPQYSSTVTRIDGEQALATGDLDRAWLNAENLLDHWDQQHVSRVYPNLAMAAAAATALDREDCGARSARVRAALDRAVAVRARDLWLPVIEAELADTTVAWLSAVKDLSDLPAPAHLLPYAQLRLGQHLVAERERTEARAVLADAADRAERLGAGLLTERIALLGRRAGFETQPAPDRGPLAALTRREVEVLELVAAGKSNGDIGHTLFISAKTASVHVSNILAKLGVAGRGEAAAVAHRAGLPVG